ncbi:MAG: hypothetical protein J0I21_17765 [Alphaproteobacteria bacterium]|nr:hypothetical protein [Alphaproteobacteria bacterium]
MQFQSAFKAVAAAAVLVAMASAAQAQTPARVRGVVESLSGHTLTVKSRDGQDVKVALSSRWRAVSVVPSTVDAIKPGVFIGTAAMGPDSDLKAVEVVVFPERMRGTAEGHYGWDLGAANSMTNGNVDGEVAAADGRQLTVSYKGGTSKITVPAGVPVVTLVPGRRSLVVPGAQVFVPGQRGADGTISAAAVLVGKDGLKPPM